MRSLVFGLLMQVCLGHAGTMLYAREYVVEPIQQMSAPETEAVFRAFRDLLDSKGLERLNYGEKPHANHAAFRIGGSTTGFEFRQDWEDILELTYSGDKNIRLRLLRIVHQEEDFTEDDLKKFVEKTEALILEATSKPVRLKLVRGNGI